MTLFCQDPGRGSVKVIYPEPFKNQEKTDWNDVLVHQGKESIQKQCLVENLGQLKNFYSIYTINKEDLKNLEQFTLPEKKQESFINRQKEMNLEI